MRKLLKRARLFCLGLCLTLGICAAACTPTEQPSPEKVTYTITVNCPEDENMLYFVKVQLQGANGFKSEQIEPTNGKAVFTLDEGEYTAVLISDALGEGQMYTYTEKKVSKSSPNATLEIVRNDTSGTNPKPNDNHIDYRIIVQDPDGKPVSGVQIQLCLDEDNGYCVNAETLTDANGTVVMHLEPGVFQIHINTPPEGFEFDNDAYKTTNAGGDFIVKLTAKK